MNRVIRQEAQGTITVFLSLILILILSLICSIIEGARVSTAKIFAERSLTSAMDSVLAQYYGPLWDEYHTFGYYTGEGSAVTQDERISELLSDYMSYTFHPDKDSDGNIADTDLYDIKPGSVGVDNGIKLTDYNGELLINEAVEYMKYREVGDGLEKLLGKLSLLEEPGKVSYIMEEKQKAEEELVEIDQEILKLMELYDGLMTSPKGIELSKDGSLMATSSFIKKICYGVISMDTVGINNRDIFAVQKNYVDPSEYFKSINDILFMIMGISNYMNSVQAEIDAAVSEVADKQASLDTLNAKEDKSDEEKQQIKTLEESIKGLSAEIEDKKTTIQKEMKSIDSLLPGIKANRDKITQLIDEIKPLIETALTSLDKIIAKLETAGPLVKQYEDVLTSQKGTLSEDVYEGLEEDLKELKRYTEAGLGGYDFPGMKAILENDLDVLTYTGNAINWGDEELASGQYSRARAYYEYAGNLLKDYQIDGLTLDYSTLVYDKSKTKTPLDKINNMIQSGLTSLVIDPDSISNSKMNTSELLPSEIHALSQENEDYGSKLSSFFGSAIFGSSNSGMGDLFGGLSDSTNTGDILGNGINSVAELLLFQEYLAEHFGMYQPPGEDKISQKPSALTYEQEYLLVGKPSDQENLDSVISRIIFTRMVFDFVSVFKDSSKRNEAKLAAAALVGFTGLPILVSITQVLILLLWSFAEALLDTSALLMGKDIPILKKSVVLELPEIFLINRNFIQEKVSTLTDTKELSLSYQEYLKIFLLMKSMNTLAYRSMDLMQENIKLRYEAENFTIANCIYGFDAKAEMLIGSKFIAFDFLQKTLDDPGGYRFVLRDSYSY